MYNICRCFGVRKKMISVFKDKYGTGKREAKKSKIKRHCACGIICWKGRTGIWTRSQQEPALSTRYRCADAYTYIYTYIILYNIDIDIYAVYELINPFIRITYARDITLSGSQTFQTSKITVYILTTHTRIHLRRIYYNTHTLYYTMWIRWKIYTNRRESAVMLCVPTYIYI